MVSVAGSGAQRVVGGDGLGAEIEAREFRRQQAACTAVAGRPDGIVGRLAVQLALRQVGQDRRDERLASVGQRQALGQLAQIGGAHGADAGEACVHHGCAHPEEHAVVVRGCSRADLLPGPAVLAIVGVGSVSAARVMEAERAQRELFSAALVLAQYAFAEVIFLERRGVGSIGLRGVGELLRRAGCLPSGKGLGQQGLGRGRW